MTPLIPITSKWFGTVDIEQGSLLQEKYLKALQPDEICILAGDHFEVLSLGKSLWKADLSFFEEQFQHIHKTHRGGKATLHNEGQLIIYPLLHLKTQKLSLKSYVELLVETSFECLLKFGLKTQIDTSDRVGVYYNHKKIVSIGLHYERGWIRHGLSINVNNDLSKFKNLEVCGCKGMEVTSLKNEGLNISLNDVYKIWFELFYRRLENCIKERQFSHTLPPQMYKDANLY